jgi:hypothetical protein
LKNIKNGTSKIHAHRTSDKRKTKTRILTSEKPNQKYTSSTGKKKKKNLIHWKRYLTSPPQIARGTPKVGQNLPTAAKKLNPPQTSWLIVTNQ